MGPFPDTLRGDGLVKVHNVLNGLEVNPSRLNNARARFSHSPPSYRSYPSGTTTRTSSPVLLLTEQQQQQRCRDERRWQLINERRASLPYYQFDAQENEEKERLWAADPETNWIRPIPIEGSFGKMVYEKIRKSWVDQGIWNDNWDDTALGLWKHEEPLELEPESETDSEADPPFSFSSSRKFCQQSQAKSRRPKSDNERRRIAERRVVREREREASRPYHQFIFQISKERERIGDESKSADGSSVTDINTRAYENVKNAWTKRGIWNMQWGILPGMSWMHEDPLEPLLDGVSVSADPVRNAPPQHHGAIEVPRSIFSTSQPSTEPNGPTESGILNASPHEPLVAIDLVGSVNGDDENTRAATKSFHASQDGHHLRPAMRQGLRSRSPISSQRDLPVADKTLGPVHQSRVSKATGKKRRGPQQRPYIAENLSTGAPLFSFSMAAAEQQPSQRDPPAADKTLGPVHQSRVSKATGKKRRGPQQRPYIAENFSTGALLFSSSMAAAEQQPSPVHTSPRRSKRLRRSVSRETKDLVRTPATGTPKRTVRPKPERDVSKANVGKFAKPQGISKRQQAKTTRGKG